MRLAQRQFSYTDQARFASVTGDCNPMHVDALQARRTQAGAPVVHGIHLLLWALDSFRAAQPDLPSLRSLRAQFNRFIYLDELVDLEVTQQGTAGARLAISVSGAPRTKLSIEFGDAWRDAPTGPIPSLEEIPFLAQPVNLDFEQMSGRSGGVSFQMSKENATLLFPAATEWLGAGRIAALAASSYLVGMVCPGLHSIYSALSASACQETVSQNSLDFHVHDTDSRFRSVDLEIAGGGLIGTIKSFARTPPVRQATMQSLAGVVGPAEFAGSVALIVGGSRGLGELAAKLIATGGGRVFITWQSGKEDAENVAQEIRSAGGACQTFAYDARKPAAEQLTQLEVTPTHIYYFATPSIFRPQSDIFVAERLKDFLAIYVEGFWELAHTLRARQPKLSIFYPSSVFITERPRGMTEYTMAKAAGEILCVDMNVSLPPAHVTVSRLPRLPTDQTASVAATEASDALETMLPIIREVQSWPR